MGDPPLWIYEIYGYPVTPPAKLFWSSRSVEERVGGQIEQVHEPGEVVVGDGTPAGEVLGEDPRVDPGDATDFVS